jgi:hypothetical protein
MDTFFQHIASTYFDDMGMWPYLRQSVGNELAYEKIIDAYMIPRVTADILRVVIVLYEFDDRHQRFEIERFGDPTDAVMTIYMLSDDNGGYDVLGISHQEKKIEASGAVLV